jgi:hypothetical protein
VVAGLTVSRGTIALLRLRLDAMAELDRVLAEVERDAD